MRLLNAETLSFEEFFENAVPRYAILSHTWGSEEVSLQQFLLPDAATRAGYSKIEKTCHLALEHGLDYAWVDTCCIDKTSSAELTEAINSMFRWYEEADICFAYLEDVPSDEGRLGRFAAVSSFAKSRWFTRGWTLQELLAPHSLDFYASDWTRIASRDDLGGPISAITGIDETYLTDFGQVSRRVALRCASVAARMGWAANRRTTRTEDMAYSLLGIFDVSMPLVYGEGTNAFMRLQEEIMRRSFDPTLLAWNVDRSGPALLPQESESFSPWRAAAELISGIRHPWYSESLPFGDGLPMGLLAPGPEYFRGCMDVVAHDTPLNWSFTSNGLEASLPVCQDLHGSIFSVDSERLYVVLPCMTRRDPWNFLALPLHRSRGLYARSPMSTKLVDHRRWHLWPQQHLLLVTKVQAATTDLGGMHPWRIFWIRSLPGGVRALEADSKDPWVPTSIPSRGLMPRLHGFTNARSTVLIQLKDDETGDNFGILVKAFKSKWLPHLWEMC